MRIICNKPGGIGLRGLRLHKGENIVDDALWAAVKQRHRNGIIEAMANPPNGEPPLLEIFDDAGQQPEPEQPRMNSRESLVAIARCDSLGELEQFKQGEDRKTVLEAIERRERVLAEAQFEGNNDGNGD